MTKVFMPALAKVLLKEARLFELTGKSEQHALIAEFAKRVAVNLTKRHNARLAQLEADENYLESLAILADPNT